MGEREGGRSGVFSSQIVAEALLAAADRTGIGTSITVQRKDGRWEAAFVNEAALALNGYDREEFMTMHPLAILAPGEFERFPTSSVQPEPTSGAMRYETTIVRKSGELLPIEVVVAKVPWADEDGAVALVCYFSELKQRRGGASAQQHGASVDRLVALGTLAAGVAHEINNPIAVTATSLEALQRMLTANSASISPDLFDRSLALIEDARAGSERVARIVRELRGLSRNADERAPVLLDRVLASAERMAEVAVHKRARVVRREIPCLVWGDAGRLEQVFVNLLFNAAQAMPAEGDGEIFVDAEEHGGMVTVSVRDTGAGIAPENLSRIFDPFFTTKPIGEGTGLGLAICNTIVTQLGGTISVESERGKGSTFRVTLPSARAPNRISHATAAPPPASVGTEAQTPAAPRARLLVVDDEPTLVRTLVTLLGEDHEVVGVTSGADALGILLGSEQFDLVLCDLMMPYVTGMDLYERLARERPGLEKKLVFMTGGAFTRRARSFLERVSNPRVDKPFSPAAVTDLLKSLTRG